MLPEIAFREGPNQSSCCRSRTRGSSRLVAGVEHPSCSVAWPRRRRSRARRRMSSISVRSRSTSTASATRSRSSRRSRSRAAAGRRRAARASWSTTSRCGAFPAGLIGGRLYFLATTPGDAFEHWWGPLAVWKGGLGIWGGIALGTLVGLWRVRRAGADVARFMDAAAPALLVAQAIGRVGNYFNQELFGRPDRPALGARDRPRPPARALPRRPDLPPDVPLRGCCGTSRSPPRWCWLGRHRAIRPPGPVRPLRHRLLRVPHRRRTAARRPGRARLRAALEPAPRDRRHAIGLAWFAATQRGGQHRADSTSSNRHAAVSSAGGRVACTAACPWRRHPFAQCGPLRRV